MIACVAIIARSNQPLLMKVYADAAEEARFHYVCHCAIDAFEEREQTLRLGSGGAKNADNYLGLLFAIEEFKVYGYVTCTGVRLAIVLDEADSKDDVVIRSFLAKLHSLYTDAVSNPFYVACEEIKSKRMDTDLSNMVRLWNADTFAAR